MCGIAGAWWKQPPLEYRQRIAASLHAMRRRGPDDEGLEVHRFDSGTLALAHVRLAIIDLTSGGHQPMASPDAAYAITFNGEIYNYRELRQALAAAEKASAVPRSTVEDVRQQCDDLVREGFLLDMGAARAAHLPRYLQAATLRLEAAPTAGARESQGMDALDRIYAALDRYLESCPPAAAASPAVQEVFWMIEELRVGLFAQRLGTAQQVSEKRVLRAIDRLPR